MKQNIKTTDDCEIMVVMTEKELSRKYTFFSCMGCCLTCLGIGFNLFIGTPLKFTLLFIGIFSWFIAMVNR